MFSKIGSIYKLACNFSNIISCDHIQNDIIFQRNNLIYHTHVGLYPHSDSYTFSNYIIFGQIALIRTEFLQDSAKYLLLQSKRVSAYWRSASNPGTLNHHTPNIALFPPQLYSAIDFLAIPNRNFEASFLDHIELPVYGHPTCICYSDHIQAPTQLHSSRHWALNLRIFLSL